MFFSEITAAGTAIYFTIVTINRYFEKREKVVDKPLQ